MANPSLPRGFGTVPAPPVNVPAGDPIQRMVAALEKIAQQVASPPLWEDWQFSQATGATDVRHFQRDVFNLVSVTVKNGELWLYLGPSTVGCPDFRFTAGDTQQRALPPNIYETITALANGAQTDACIKFGFV